MIFSAEEELVEKNALIEALEKGLMEATETIDESASEIKRLQMLVRDYETRLGQAQEEGQRGADPVDETASVIERASVNSWSVQGSGTLQKHTITKMGAIIIEDDGQDEVTVIENHAVKELSDKVYMIEFENMHLKEKLEKVLHTVDCLNDEIANLKEELQAKEDLINSLKSNSKPISTSRRKVLSTTPAVTSEPKKTEPAPPKRIWGPAAKAAAVKETPPVPASTYVPPASPVTPFNLSKGRRALKESKAVNHDPVDDPDSNNPLQNSSFDAGPETGRSRALTLRSGSEGADTPRKQTLNTNSDGSGTPSRKSSLTPSNARAFASTGQKKKIIL